MKKKIIAVVVVALSAVCAYIGVDSQDKSSKLSDIQLANVEALAQGEITVVGCKPLKGATCYVFDGSGQLVDKQKNQYPGN